MIRRQLPEWKEIPAWQRREIAGVIRFSEWIGGAKGFMLGVIVGGGVALWVLL